MEINNFLLIGISQYSRNKMNKFFLHVFRKMGDF